MDEERRPGWYEDQMKECWTWVAAVLDDVMVCVCGLINTRTYSTRFEAESEFCGRTLDRKTRKDTG